MNIRLENQSIRFRISAEEHKQLLAGIAVSSSTLLADSVSITYTIIPSNDLPTMYLQFMEGVITLSVPLETLKQLSSPLPKREGVEVKQKIADRELSLSLEVDSKSRHRQ